MRTVLEMFSSVFSFYKIKVIVNENVRITDHASGIRLPNWSKFAINWKNDSDIRIYQHGVTVKFFDVAMFLLSYLVTDPSFMSISLVVLEFWQLSFVRDWPEIPKLEIPSSEFFSTSGDWGELGIPNVK